MENDLSRTCARLEKNKGEDNGGGRAMDGEGNRERGRKEKSSARSRIERRYKERKGSARETVNEEEAHKHDVCEPKVSNLRSVLRQL